MAVSKLDALTGFHQGVNGWVKFPDGTAIQWARKSITRNAGQNLATDNFYFPFLSTPTCWCNFMTGHPEIWFATVNDATTTQITVCLYNTGTTQTTGSTVDWVAIGRWK